MAYEIISFNPESGQMGVVYDATWSNSFFVPVHNGKFITGKALEDFIERQRPTKVIQKIQQSRSANNGHEISQLVKVFKDPPQPEPTLEEKIAKHTYAIDDYVNAVAFSRGYRNIDSVTKYMLTANPYKAEATALAEWNTQVWVAALDLLGQFERGEIPEPTPEEVEAVLPPPPVAGVDY